MENENIDKVQINRRYSIRDSYVFRTEESFYDDTINKDEWQREVYEFALKIAKENNLNTVMDIGCGSAYKLLTYFDGYDTVGLDISPTYEWLLDKYPNKKWLKCSFEDIYPESVDLVICSDVIEHLKEPDQLLEFILQLDCRYIVLSTPDRNSNLFSPTGPPINLTHIREWTFEEFKSYISCRFEVIDHIISNVNQGTQCLLCRKKSATAEQ